MNSMPGRVLPTLAPELERPRARPRQTGPFGVLDIGTTKIVCIIGRVDPDGSIRVLGFGWQRGDGVRAGGITDIEKAERVIRAAVGAAEVMADTRLRSVAVNLSCGQPETRLFNVQWPVGGRAVTEADIRRVLHEGRSRAFAEGREIIHALPLSFAADEMQGVLDPRGLHCELLTARLHVVDAATTALRTLGACVARCDLDISEVVSAPMAAGLATLVEDERILGATVLDMGGGTTGMAVFAEGQLLHTAQLPVGGSHVTSDIARVLSTPIGDAERLKALYGSTQPSPDDEREMLGVSLVGEEDHHVVHHPRSMLVKIIRPRLEETFEMVKERLEGCGLGRVAGTRVVLTGGASQLSGVREMAATILGRTVRHGRPTALRGLPEIATGPAFAAAVGLLAWSAGEGRSLHDVDFESERPKGWIRRTVKFLRERL
jgi:cell division protein FtsA